jgi:hypothetical protein
MFPAVVAIRHDRLEPSTIIGANIDLDPLTHPDMVACPYTRWDSYDRGPALEHFHFR